MRLFNPINPKRKTSDQCLSEAIYNIFGYRPKNVAIYQLAFRHKSRADAENNGFVKSNERLEYLGDAVLGSAVADFLFKKFPYKDEGFLTEMRSRIVSRTNLNMLSRKLGLHQLVQVSRDTNVHTSSSVMGDAFEAFVGALYLDRGYEFAKNIIIRQIIQTHLDIDELLLRDVNFKSKIIEWAQKEKMDLDFKLIAEEDHGRKGKLYSVELWIQNKLQGHGQDFSIKKAEQHAAQQAWEKINNPG